MPVFQFSFENCNIIHVKIIFIKCFLLWLFSTKIMHFYDNSVRRRTRITKFWDNTFRRQSIAYPVAQHGNSSSSSSSWSVRKERFEFQRTSHNRLFHSIKVIDFQFNCIIASHIISQNLPVKWFFQINNDFKQIKLNSAQQ